MEKNLFRGTSPPSVFVSWNNYPKISIAPLSSTQVLQNASFLDDSQNWFGLSKKEIISMRGQLVRSVLPINAFDAKNPSAKLSLLQELAMASNALDVSVELKSKPIDSMSFSDSAAPLGPRALLKNFELNSSPKIEKKVDYIVSDTDAKSADSLNELFYSDFSVGFISKLLSAGLLGEKKSRKFVPTKWSITATDSSLSENLIEEKIKGFSNIDRTQIFSASYLDNNFFILLAPHSWAFEQLEVMLSETDPKIISDFEFFDKRKDYASNVAGAYYAARLAVAEYLLKIRRQAAVVVFREIGRSYKRSLGVWVIRESIRAAMQKNPIDFASTSLALQFLEKKFFVPVGKYRLSSKVLDLVLHQKSLADF